MSISIRNIWLNKEIVRREKAGARKLVSDGFMRGRAAPTIFCHFVTDVGAGDESTFAGTEVELRKVHAKMVRGALEVQVEIIETLRFCAEHSNGRMKDWRTKPTRNTSKRCCEESD